MCVDLKTETEIFLKRSGARLKFYATPTLIGTILVAIAVLNVSFDAVSSFMAMEEKGQIVGPRNYQLFHIRVMLAALTTWYAFINPAWQRPRQKHEQAERHETEAVAKTPPANPGRLTHLG